MGYYSEVQKRREQKLAQLRKINNLPERPRKTFSKKVEFEVNNKLFTKSIVALVLFSFTYLVFQINIPYTKPIQGFIKEAMTRDYNFSSVYGWYTKRFAGNPGILPTFSLDGKINATTKSFPKPIKGLPVGIKKAGNGIYLETGLNESVISIDKGIVKSVENNPSLGQTITIIHQNGIQTTYGLLYTIDVKKDDWIKEGQILGLASKKMYFEIKNGEEYLNPLDVISLE